MPSAPTAMTPWAELQALLRSRRAFLQARLQRANESMLDRGAQASHEVGDRKDEAADEVLATLDRAAGDRDRDELGEVEASLQRIDSGDYGRCLDCGEAIPVARLRAQPAAPCCTACQQDRERRSAS